MNVLWTLSLFNLPYRPVTVTIHLSSLQAEENEEQRSAIVVVTDLTFPISYVIPGS
jgi:hypothetical protein